MASAATALQRLVQLVRAYMRDYPQLNEIVRGEESTDRTIGQVILETVDDFNLNSPLSSRTVETFPSTHLLVIGTVARLLMSVAILQARNNLSYSDGQGTQINRSDKSGIYMQLANNLMSEYERKRDELISKLNIKSVGGGGALASDYSLLEELEDDGRLL